MTIPVEKVYSKVVPLAGDQGMKLSKTDYRELMEELAAHFSLLVTALDEEEGE